MKSNFHYINIFTPSTWIHLLAKSDVKFVLSSFIQLIENNFFSKLKKLIYDNAKEFFFYMICFHHQKEFFMKLRLLNKIVSINKSTNIY